MSVQHVDVVYDGLCRFCVRSIRVVRSLDVLGRVSFHDANERDAVVAEFPALADADLDDAMYAIDASGRRYRGFYAFRRLTWALPPAWWLIPLLYFPGVSIVGERVYGYVARNRSRLGCRVGERWLNSRVSDVGEINRGYVPSAPDVPAAPVSVDVQAFVARLNSRRTDAVRVLLLPALFLTALVLLVVLDVRLRLRRPVESWLHDAAAERVTAFVEQYPLHLYPILAKAFEAAYLERFIPELLSDSPRILEVAIGDGTLSERVFPADADVVGLDIAPYVLRHASLKPHVRRAVACDCMSPPIAAGSFDVLVANNFLHHVTAKEETLSRWAPIARIVLFNENTPFWASAWVWPHVLDRLGFRRKAREAAKKIELIHLQSLGPLADLDRAVSASWNIRERKTFLTARTFFRCAIFSALMRCTGPPTPSVLKRLLLGPLRRPSIPLTRAIARRLVALDATEDRATDVYVSYLAESRGWRGTGGFTCPRCGAELDSSDRCSGCGHQYETIDGMLFLLPPELDHIRRDYSRTFAATVPAELL